MFFKKSHVGGKTYISIVESYRNDNGKPAHRIIASLGLLDNFKASGALQRLANSLLQLTDKKESKQKSDLIELGRFNWGAAKIVRSLWERYKLDKIFLFLKKKAKYKINIEENIFHMVLNRLVSPDSKLGLYENHKRFLFTNTISLHEIYRTLDFLSENKESIETLLFETSKDVFNQEIDFVFYDVTTFHFESTSVDLMKKFGFSKNCKFNEVQIVLGLLIDTKGIPIGFEVFPGNTFEGKTLLSSLEKMKNRFKIRQVVIVADRGLNAKINLKHIRDAGFDYIVGTKISSLTKDLKEKVLDINNYKCASIEEEHKLKYYTFTRENKVRFRNESVKKMETHSILEKIVCTWSAKRAEKDAFDRERLVKKAEKLIAESTSDELKSRSAKYVDVKIDKPTLKADKIKNDAKYDGFYAIQTSRTELNEKEVISAYRTLWKIEESFRILKSQLQTRPMFHWTPERITGHLVVCFITFLLERSIELQLADCGIKYSPTLIQEAINSLECSLVECGEEKFYLRSNTSELAKTILKVNNIALPNNMTPASEFK